MSMEHEGLTKTIIGCAYKVYNAMGFGYLESVYEKCMVIELSNSGLSVQAQVPIKVRYKGTVVGDFIADLLVEKDVIVELKAVKKRWYLLTKCNWSTILSPQASQSVCLSTLVSGRWM